MALTIISVKESQGEYMNKPYHNFVVTAMNPETTNQKIVAGCEVIPLKIKADEFPIMLGRAIGALGDPNVTKVQDIIGLYVLPVFNQYGVCTDFSLAAPEVVEVLNETTTTAKSGTNNAAPEKKK